MLAQLVSDAQTLHHCQFGVTPDWVASAPGRVNLIGDHTDYTGGFAMPFAIDRYTLVTASLGTGTTHQVYSDFAQQQIELTLGPPSKRQAGAAWYDYVVGVLTLMASQGHQVPPLKISIHGNLPVGSGLSSSASLELAVASLIEGVSGKSMDAMQKMLLCQQVEHEYALVPCGLMDQFSVCAGQRDHLLLLDCLAQTAEMVAIPGDDIRFLIIDSQVRHQHSGGGYAERRDQCFAAQEILGCSLREATPQSVASIPDATLRQRAQHVVSENARVAKLAEAMRSKNFVLAGQIMNLSHLSLRDDFAVSCTPVDQLVELAQQQPGVYGARMTGGGFGGSVVAMAQPAQVEAIAQALTLAYKQATELSTQPLLVVAVDGAQLHSI